jgi:hypothetical protein
MKPVNGAIFQAHNSAGFQSATTFFQERNLLLKRKTSEIY